MVDVYGGLVGDHHAAMASFESLSAGTITLLPANSVFHGTNNSIEIRK
jgi:hypothetical protein